MTKLCFDYMSATSTVDNARRMSTKASLHLFARLSSPSTLSHRNVSPADAGQSMKNQLLGAS